MELGLIPGALYIVFNPDGIAHRPLELRALAAGAEVYAAAALAQLRLRGHAGRTGRDDSAREPTAAAARRGRLGGDFRAASLGR